MIRLIYIFLFTSLHCHSSHSLTNYQKEITKHRSEYIQSLLEIDQSPLSDKSIGKVTYFEIAEDYRCNCDYTIEKDAQPFAMSTYSGDTKLYKKYATLTCRVKGKNIVLSVYQNMQYANIPGMNKRLFLPFKDLTNGSTTYGGGRYLDLAMWDTEATKVTVDFNKAYNPWCAYSDGYSCPIPPIENHLDLKISAGEKNYHTEKDKSYN